VRAYSGAKRVALARHVVGAGGANGVTMSSPTLERPLPLRRADAPGGQPPAACTTCHCDSCCVGTLCLPGGLRDDDLRPLASLSLVTRRFSAGESIYRDGDPFRFVYAVRSGTCKTTLLRHDGHEQVAGFHLAGDFMGLEGLAEGVHGTTAAALEDSQVCLIPYQRLRSATAAFPGARDLLSHVMSREIIHEHSLLVLLGLTDAPQRLAAFLLDLSQRYAARGWSPCEFQLRMSRGDIASFLGVTLETISRTFSLLQRRGFIAKQGRRIRLLDLDGLRAAYDLRIR
jgi:CRP/FNR family transcriptional regulator, anaerobic regulatory protein